MGGGDSRARAARDFEIYENDRFSFNPFPPPKTPHGGARGCRHKKVVFVDDDVCLITLYFIYLDDDSRVHVAEQSSRVGVRTTAKQAGPRLNCEAAAAYRQAPWRAACTAHALLDWATVGH